MVDTNNGRLTPQQRELARVLFINLKIPIDIIELGITRDSHIVKGVSYLETELERLSMKFKFLAPAIQEKYPDITSEDLRDYFGDWNGTPAYHSPGSEFGLHLDGKGDNKRRYQVMFSVVSEEPYLIVRTEDSEHIAATSLEGRNILCTALMMFDGMIDMDNKSITPLAEVFLDKLPPVATIHE